MHSLRDSDSWWESVDETAFQVLRSEDSDEPPFTKAWQSMDLDVMAARIPPAMNDRQGCIEAY